MYKRQKLTQAIDGKGAFRRFKDVLMSYGPDRERWFTFRGERLRTFMEAWLTAHAIAPVARPVWADVPAPPESEAPPESSEDGAPKSQGGRRARSADTLRQQLKDVAETLGPRDLDLVTTFAEFLKEMCIRDSAMTFPFSTLMSILVTSATRRSRSEPAAVSTAMRPASSHDFSLTPTTSIIR